MIDWETSIIDWYKKLLIGATVFLVFCIVASVAMRAHAATLPSILEWSNPVDVTDQIRVEKSGSITMPFTKLTDLSANSLTYTDATNGPGDTACYKIAYFNSSGLGPYAGPVCKIFPTVPGQSPATFTVK